MRRDTVWRKARWIPDAAAAVDAAVWESIHAGVTDSQTLYDVARLRGRRPAPLGDAAASAPADVSRSTWRTRRSGPSR